MNKRIKELMKQAMELKDPYGYEGELGPKRLDEEKFAELLIQKCAQIGAQYADGNYEVPNRILEYFGLEEPEE